MYKYKSRTPEEMTFGDATLKTCTVKHVQTLESSSLSHVDDLFPSIGVVQAQGSAF